MVRWSRPVCERGSFSSRFYGESSVRLGGAVRLLGMKTTPYWLETAEEISFPALASDLQVDVLVVGAGITGLTAAWLLRKAGRRVAVIDRGRIAEGQTGHTTAHFTQVTDVLLMDLVKDFGKDHAQAIWDAHGAALDQLRAIVAELGIDCELRNVPAFMLVAEDSPDPEKETQEMRDEAQTDRELGFPGEFIERGPISGQPGIRYANQWKFHSVKYVRALAKAYVEAGGLLFEQTEAREFHTDPTRVETTGGQTISYEHLVLATHNPLTGHKGFMTQTLLQTKIAPYSTYAVEGRIPTGTVPEMLWWDTAEPYLYLRIDRHEDGDVAILGGEDHKTGQDMEGEGEPEARFQRLEKKLQEMIPGVTLERRWSGQVIEPVDGVPYIGRMGEKQYTGTGYAGHGTSFGTLAGMMISDLIVRGSSPWEDLFAVDRKKLSATWDYLMENKDYPYYLAKGYLSRGEKSPIEKLQPGEGGLLQRDGHKVAACCDDAGNRHVLSPICPHMGCTVDWNEAERTWDCPCHGSRFHANGKVFSGPAESDLSPAEG
jgi:glycine/D-amino acid oxidase-like deaminating enzyme/nitrite reductase/ring-hydroxylating ferredoxin subunit